MRRILDTRLGAAAGLALIITCFLPVALFILSQMDFLKKQQTVFQALEMREAFVALSDLQRVNLLVMRAINAGEMTVANARDLEAAVDFLYVRNQAFRKRVVTENASNSTRIALEHMERVIDLIDVSRSNAYAHLWELSEDLITETDEARRLLFVFLDERRRHYDLFTRNQQAQIERQSVLLLAFLLSLTVAGSAAFLFFRRESRMRRKFESANERAHFLAFYDPLTTLPNRVLFRERVEKMIATGSPVAMIFADMDKFKAINDTFGHAMGDAVLKSVASQLRRIAAQHDGQAARLSGDEFAVAIPNVTPSAIEDIGNALISACALPVMMENESVVPEMSLGVATTDGDRHAEPSFDLMLRMADFALYAAKSSGRGQLTVFDAELEAQFNERRTLMSELPGAILDGSIEVYLQPKFMVDSRRVYGFEALARWYRDGALLPPGEFIELAESSGAIVELDLYILRNAARLIADWNRREGQQLSVSANFSAAHFRSLDIVDQVAAALNASGLPPHLLTLEITETVQILNWEQVRRAMKRIRQLGCRVAIDDFGSGYSSLAYLRAIEADELKIDRFLMSEIESSQEARFILDTVVDLAHSLRMEVVVEGVETDSQLQSLKALGCRKAQGFLMGRPTPALDALAMFGAPATPIEAAGAH